MTDPSSRDAVSKALWSRQLLGAADVRALLLGTLLLRLAGRMFALAIVLYAFGTDRFAVARRMAGLCRHGTRSGNQSGGRRTHRPSGLGVGDNRRYDGERGLRCGTDSGRSPGLGKCPSAARSGKPVFADQSAEYGRGPLAASAPGTCDGTRPRECHGYGNPWPVGHRRSCVGRRDCRFRWIGAGTWHDRDHLHDCRAVRRHRFADRAADCHVWVRCCRRHAAECRVSCDTPRCAASQWPIRSTKFHGESWSLSCRCTRRASLPAARAPPSPACSGHALVSSVESRP